MNNLKMMLGAVAVAAMMAPGVAAADPGKGNGHGNSAKAAAKAAVPAAAVHANGHVDMKPAAKPGKAMAVDRANGARRVVREVRADNYFDRNDEAAIRSYYGNSAACPPGLAAKNNGCLPPGQAKKTYRVGTILPSGLTLAPLPGDLLGRLPVAPDGYYYGRTNGDVYLVENSTRRIVDTILLNLLR